jgi:hypothetical protein
MMRLGGVVLGFLGLWTGAAAGNGRLTGNSPSSIQQEYQVEVVKTHVPVVVDGVLDETVWQQAKGVSSFWKKYPTDNEQARRQTTAYVAHDDKFLYVAFEAYDSGKAFIRTLKRDGGHDGSDGVALVLDPHNQHTNGFFFVVNAFNAQSEDLLSGGDGPNFSWDNKWFSATQQHPDRWVAEMAIPFKTLRYKSDLDVWGINFVRIDTKTNEYSCWTRLPVNFSSHDLGYTGALRWSSPPPPAGSNIALAPFATGQLTSQNTGPGQQYYGKASGGFDAKIGLSTALNLDLTLNPDFSQIEVDRQVTNFTRFNIFLPERRTFFLENADLFAEFGIDPIRPFYSRRIGLDKVGNTIPIIGGARITGSITPSTRIGAFNMQTADKASYRKENFTAATVNQRIFKRSVLKGYFLNRAGLLTEEEKKADPLAAFGRNAGLEYIYSNMPGTWKAWAAAHKSWKPSIDAKDWYFDGGFAYDTRKLKIVTDVVSVGTNYYTDMGFVQRIENYDAERDTTIRLGFRHLFNEAQYRFFPKKGKVVTYRVGGENYVVWNPDGSLNEINAEGKFNAEFRNTSYFNCGPEYNAVNLLYPVSFTGGKPLPVGNYRYLRGFISYDSDFRKPFAASGRISAGEFYNGTFTSFGASVTYRKPPHVSVTLQAEYNRLQFPGEYGSAELVLISPRIDLNFTTSIFWTTFLQYNTQANNFNINSRFQWRFRPMSDLYLVYTDNYFSDPTLKNKNRAIVLKISYWINM